MGRRGVRFLWWADKGWFGLGLQQSTRTRGDPAGMSRTARRTVDLSRPHFGEQVDAAVHWLRFCGEFGGESAMGYFSVWFLPCFPLRVVLVVVQHGSSTSPLVLQTKITKRLQLLFSVTPSMTPPPLLPRTPAHAPCRCNSDDNGAKNHCHSGSAPASAPRISGRGQAVRQRTDWQGPATSSRPSRSFAAPHGPGLR